MIEHMIESRHDIERMIESRHEIERSRHDRALLSQDMIERYIMYHVRTPLFLFGKGVFDHTCLA